jgi:hypothetical protein
MTDAATYFAFGLLAGFILGSGQTLILLALCKIWPFNKGKP